MGGTEPWPGSCLTIGSTTSPATSNPSSKALLARNTRRQSAVSLHGRQASRGADFPSSLHSRASLRAPLPHPAAPVQHQPAPCNAVLRLAPGRSGGHGRAVRTVEQPVGDAGAGATGGAAPKDCSNFLSTSHSPAMRQGTGFTPVCKISPDIAFILLLDHPRQNGNIKEWGRGI